MFRNLVSFYGEKHLALHLARKVEDRIFSTVRNFLYGILSFTLHIRKSFRSTQIEDAPCRLRGLLEWNEYMSKYLFVAEFQRP
jgi:hypothetical protein